jgi:hypothetical protein
MAQSIRSRDTFLPLFDPEFCHKMDHWSSIFVSSCTYGLPEIRVVASFLEYQRLKIYGEAFDGGVRFHRSIIGHYRLNC